MGVCLCIYSVCIYIILYYIYIVYIYIFDADRLHMDGYIFFYRSVIHTHTDAIHMYVTSIEELCVKDNFKDLHFGYFNL